MLSITVTTTSDIVDVNDGATSLREAIFAANTVPGADAIDFAPALTANGPATILLTQGELPITEALTITGPGADLLTIDAQQQSRIFDITATTGDFTISGLTLTHGALTADGTGPYDPTVSGGAILCASNGLLTLDHATITANAVSGINSAGGGVYGANVTLVDSTVSANSTFSNGGALFATSSLTLTRTTVSGNTGTGARGGTFVATASTISGNKGGGLIAQSAMLTDSNILDNINGFRQGGLFVQQDATITNCIISGNSTLSFYGGGVYCGGNLTIADSTISNNTALLFGGGVFVGGAATLTNSKIANNSVSRQGGGIYSRSAAGLTLTGCTISGNLVKDFDGGGVFSLAGLVKLNGCDISSNRAGRKGGGICAATIDAADLTLSNNTGGTGGGIYASYVSELTRCTISGNAAAGISGYLNGRGGGIDITTGNLVASNCTIVSNSAAGARGGGMYGAADVSLTNCTVSGNTTSGGTPYGAVAARGGGGVFAARNLTLEDCKVDGNSTSGNGAGGGGVAAMTVAVTDSQFTNNSTNGSYSPGGGIFAQNGATITNCTVSGNSTKGGSAAGGGIFGALIVSACTISNNSTASFSSPGGGLVTLKSTSKIASITSSTISGNQTSGTSSYGGGVSVSNVTIQNSVISGNSTLGDFSSGGGIGSPNTGQNTSVVLLASVVSNNSTAGGTSRGGGIGCEFGNAQLTDCIVSNNSTRGDRASGGGIISPKSISDCLISGNVTYGDSAPGGGIAAYINLTISNSTVTGNRVDGRTRGGGVFAAALTNILFSDITNNSANSTIDARGGGGIYGHATVTGSIIAGNTAGSGVPDFFALGGGSLTFSLIGNKNGTSFAEAPIGSPDANGNLIGGPVHGTIAPLLGPLTYNGGLTFLDGSKMLTQALLPGSPAINAGDPAAVAGANGVPQFDERDTPFTRVFGGRIDIGAFESQSNPLPGDYNFNGVVDAADYIVWRATLGATNDLRADGNGNGTVDAADYSFWTARFGNTLAGSGAGSSFAVTETNVQPAVVNDAAVSTQAPFAARIMSSHDLAQQSTIDNEQCPIDPPSAIGTRQFFPTPGRVDAALALRSMPLAPDAAVHESALLNWLATRSGANRGSHEATPPVHASKGGEEGCDVAALDQAFEALAVRL